MSDERLRVLRIMLPNGPDEQFTDPMMPEQLVVLPRSAKGRKVQFLPAQSSQQMSIVVIGSRDGDTSCCPIAVYLKPSDLGQWINAPQDGLEEGTKSNSWRAGAQFEEWDPQEDCDAMPYDPGFQIC